MTTDDLANPLWRLRNLYHIKRADDGRIIKFEPRPEQQRVYDMLFKQGVKRLIILKARRLGMSTALDVLLTDQMLWNAGTQCSLVDQTAADAERKLATIAKVALDNLPPVALQCIEKVRDSGSILEVSVAGVPRRRSLPDFAPAAAPTTGSTSPSGGSFKPTTRGAVRKF